MRVTITTGSILARALPCVAAVLSAAVVLATVGVTSAEAKPTGWMSRTEAGASAALEPWRGYGEAGYVGEARRAKNSASHARLRARLTDEGYTPKHSHKAHRKYAALTNSLSDAAPAKSLTGGGVRWAAPSSCLNGTLVGVVQHVAATYGSVTVSSTCRCRGHNAAVGGARHSQHLSGNAVDFRVHGNYGAAMAYLRGFGGFHHYGGGLFHVDTGPHRTW